MLQKPAGITALGIILNILGTLGIFSSINYAMFHRSYSIFIGSIIYLCTSILNVAAGTSLLNLKEWGRILTIIAIINYPIALTASIIFLIPISIPDNRIIFPIVMLVIMVLSLIIRYLNDDSIRACFGQVSNDLIICPNCGYSCSVFDDYCANCGFKLH